MRRGIEVVLYAADTATGVTLPAQQLVGFARVDLEPGASKTVTFVVPMSLLAYTGVTDELVMEPGPVDLSAGSSSSDLRSSATFTVTGAKRVISGEDRAFLSVLKKRARGRGDRGAQRVTRGEHPVVSLSLLDLVAAAGANGRDGGR